MKRIILFCFIVLSVFTGPESVRAFTFDQEPTRIIIPSIQISLPISVAKITYDTWEVSNTGASFGESTTLPGRAGNTVIFGHSMPHLFASLPNVKKGDVVHVFTDDDWFTYRIFETKIVSPENIDVLSRNYEHELTLYTCTGENYSERFVVKAILDTTVPAK